MGWITRKTSRCHRRKWCLPGNPAHQGRIRIALARQRLFLGPQLHFSWSGCMLVVPLRFAHIYRVALLILCRVRCTPLLKERAQRGGHFLFFLSSSHPSLHLFAYWFTFLLLVGFYPLQCLSGSQTILHNLWAHRFIYVLAPV